MHFVILLPTVFSTRMNQLDSCHKEGLNQCYVGTLWKDGLPIHHRAPQEYNNTDVQFILDALVGRMSCDF